MIEKEEKGECTCVRKRGSEGRVRERVCVGGVCA